MLTILLVSALLVTVCVVFHGFALQSIAELLFRKQNFSFYRVSVLIAAAIVAHLIEIVAFQIGYIWLIGLERLGKIEGASGLNRELEVFYFSAATYTATGYGDLVPSQYLRLFATVEALTGLIMIAWTASFAFLVMQRYWQEQDSKQKQDSKQD